MVWAASLSTPLLGTASRSISGHPCRSGRYRSRSRQWAPAGALQALVRPGERVVVGDQEERDVGEERGDRVGGPLVRLVPGGHPARGGLLDDPVAEGMAAAGRGGQGAGARTEKTECGPAVFS